MSDVPVIAEKKPPTTSQRRGVLFIDLEYGMCRFPLGGPTDPPERFCGAPAQPGQPYCPACRTRAYLPARPR